VERFGVLGHTSHEALAVNPTCVGSFGSNRRGSARGNRLTHLVWRVTYARLPVSDPQVLVW